MNVEKEIISETKPVTEKAKQPQTQPTQKETLVHITQDLETLETKPIQV